MGDDTSQDKGNSIMGHQIAACTGPDAREVIVKWVREQGYTPDDVKILQRGDTVWAERLTSASKSDSR